MAQKVVKLLLMISIAILVVIPAVISEETSEVTPMPGQATESEDVPDLRTEDFGKKEEHNHPPTLEVAVSPSSKRAIKGTGTEKGEGGTEDNLFLITAIGNDEDGDPLEYRFVIFGLIPGTSEKFKISELPYEAPPEGKYPKLTIANNAKPIKYPVTVYVRDSHEAVTSKEVTVEVIDPYRSNDEDGQSQPSAPEGAWKGESALSDYTVEGQLVSSFQEPLPGAAIWLFYVGDPNPVASAVTDQEGFFEMNNVPAYDIICPYQPGYTFQPVWNSPSGEKYNKFTGWLGTRSSTYLVYVAAVTSDRKLIEGVDVTFSGQSIGTLRAQTTNSGGWVDGASSILTFTPETPYSGQYQVTLSGLVNISASKPGWTFEPSAVQVEGSRIVMFVGTNTTNASISTAPDTPPQATGQGKFELEENTDRLGSDYRHFILKADDPKLCEEECANEAECKAFTYVKPGVRSHKKPECWLKNAVPDPLSNKACCISGVKRLDGLSEGSVDST